MAREAPSPDGSPKFGGTFVTPGHFKDSLLICCWLETILPFPFLTMPLLILLSIQHSS